MPSENPELAELLSQEDELQFATFTNTTAWDLGCALVDAARRDGLAVTEEPELLVRHRDASVVAGSTC